MKLIIVMRRTEKVDKYLVRDSLNASIVPLIIRDTTRRNPKETINDADNNLFFKKFSQPRLGFAFTRHIIFNESCISTNKLVEPTRSVTILIAKAKCVLPEN